MTNNNESKPEKDQQLVNSSKEQSDDTNNDHNYTDQELCTSQMIREIDNDDTKCGAGSFRPKWAQVFSSKFMYMVLYSIIGVVSRMYYTYMMATLTTIEKRFNFSSKYSGLILAGDDISQVLFVVILAYFGNYSHRPRLMGIGSLFVAGSCFVATLPHFIYGPGREAEELARGNVYQENNNNSKMTGTDQMCGLNEEVCSDEDRNSSLTMYTPIVLFFLGQCCEGIASSLFITLGNTYLDDNIEKKKYPIFYAMSALLRIMGPVLGFLLASKCLALWIDPSNPPSLSTKDPRWLGAWWIGYIGGGIILTIVGLIIMMFPKQLPEAFYRDVRKVQIKYKKNNENATSKQIMETLKIKKKQTKPTLKKFPVVVKRILKNKLWLAATFDLTFVLLGVIGYWSFKPKYLQAQFRKSASAASFWTGTVSLISSAVGIMAGGIVLRWIRPSAKIVTGYSLFLAYLASATMIGLSFVYCPSIDIIGPNYDYSTMNNCNSNCNCTLEFSPVCAEDGKTVFYSPCYAGCTQASFGRKEANFTNCLCIPKSDVDELSLNITNMDLPKSLENDPPIVMGGKAKRGYCEEECNGFNIYMIITCITSMLHSSSRVSGSMLFLRIVRPEDKAIAMGMVTVILSLFAFIPAPLIMGAVLDATCKIWKESCGNKGSCYQYDTDKFRLVIHIIPAVLFLVSSLGDMYVFKHSDKLKLYAEDDEREQDETENQLEKETLM